MDAQARPSVPGRDGGTDPPSLVNYRQAMLDVLAGGVPERPLLVPRLDIWHNVNRQRGTLPPGFENLSLRGTARKLGVGLHSVVPDCLRTGDERGIHHRALGFYSHPDFPWEADFGAIDHEVELRGGELRVTSDDLIRGKRGCRFFLNLNLNRNLNLDPSEIMIKSKIKIKIFPQHHFPPKFANRGERIRNSEPIS